MPWRARGRKHARARAHGLVAARALAERHADVCPLVAGVERVAEVRHAPHEVIGREGLVPRRRAQKDVHVQWRVRLERAADAAVVSRAEAADEVDE